VKLTDERKKLLVVHLPDTRGVVISPFGKGNLKLGPNVYTYSRVAGKYELMGTCPGSTPECEEICYAKRITGIVREQYRVNSLRSTVPELPEDARYLRIHVSGDFDTPDYINGWRGRLLQRPDVTAWAYTRSWRVPHLAEWLEELRALPNMQLFASMDISTKEMPPAGWRVAWIDEDHRANLTDTKLDNRLTIHDGTIGWGYVCPEQTGRKVNCEQCRYCFDGQKHDVIFLQH
jgi:hypothetical protein